MRRHFDHFFRLLPIVLLVVAAGCAGPSQVTKGKPVPAEQAAAAHKPRELIVFIPQTEEGAPSWFKLFARHPRLRMVIAMSPRFRRFDKEPAIKAQAVALQKSGRLELALQLPNAPFLPLLIDSNSAKDAVAPGSALPSPPFSYPDDVIQIIARAKADFFHTWNELPRGVALPYGAASPGLFSLFDRLGFAWMIAALGAAPVDGAYRAGSLAVWDGASATPPPLANVRAADVRGGGASERSVGTTVSVWDERMMKDPAQSLRILDAWAQELEKKDMDPILPSDPGLPTQPMPADQLWARRTWATKDWTTWIGSPHKNDAWNWLRKTRSAVESYKNSGQASVKRMDMAFEELYQAENANYFASDADNREHEFKATLSSVYRLIGQTPPEDLFSEEAGTSVPVQALSSTTVTAEVLPDGREHILFEDPPGDDHGAGRLPDPPGPRLPGAYDLRRLEVWASSETVEWAVTLGALAIPSLGASQNPGPLIDIYIDLNGEPDVGTTAFLPFRGLVPASRDAWEYAISLSGTQATLYRTQSGGTYQIADTFPLTFIGSSVHVVIPRASMRGSPRRWGYQVLVMAYDQLSPEGSPQPFQTASPGNVSSPVYDLLDPLEVPQIQLLNDIESGKRSDVPFVRVRSNK